MTEMIMIKNIWNEIQFRWLFTSEKDTKIILHSNSSYIWFKWQKEVLSNCL